MAGRFPSGYEYNVFKDSTASKIVYAEWPTPMLLSGFEIGEAIKTGLPLSRNAAIKNSPIRDVFRISIPLDPADKAGRMSWDQTAVLVAIDGPEPYYSTQSGRLVMGRGGSNTWGSSGKGHAYLVVKRPPAEVQALIEGMMAR